MPAGGLCGKSQKPSPEDQQNAQTTAWLTEGDQSQRVRDTLFTSASEILWSWLAVFNGGCFVQLEKYLHGANISRGLCGCSKTISLNANIPVLCVISTAACIWNEASPLPPK